VYQRDGELPRDLGPLVELRSEGECGAEVLEAGGPVERRLRDSQVAKQGHPIALRRRLGQRASEVCDRWFWRARRKRVGRGGAQDGDDGRVTARLHGKQVDRDLVGGRLRPVEQVCRTCVPARPLVGRQLGVHRRLDYRVNELERLAVRDQVLRGKGVGRGHRGVLVELRQRGGSSQ